MASPQPNQPLILYVSATHTAVSGAHVQEREICKENRKLSQQVSIYFVFEALTGSKKYYSKIEKICYTVVMSARKRCHYFKAHRVRLLTN
jgi:ribonuclease HI